MHYFKKYFIARFLNELFSKRLQNSRAKGIDKHNARTFLKQRLEQVEIIEKKCLSASYKFTPFLELLKLKGRDKLPRAISIPTIRDRLVLLALKEYLHDFYKERVNRKRPNAFIKEIKNHLSINPKNNFYIKLDIKSFYDTIDHDILIQMLTESKIDPLALNLIKSVITTPTVPVNCNKEQYNNFIPKKGVPQGTSISNILAQIYLTKLDGVLNRRSYFYQRYVDDILVINNDPISKFRINNLKKVITDLNLTMHEGKEEEGLLKDSFDFLGYNISETSISIAQKNTELFIRRLAGKFTWFKNGIEIPSKRPQWLIKDDKKFAEVFVEELNDSITGVISENKNYGWLFYFSESTDMSLLFKIDKIIKSLFEKIEHFDNKAPTSLKTLVRTYHCINFKSNTKYIPNYSDYDTIRKQRNFLEHRGFIDPDNEYQDWEIKSLFSKYRNKQLKYVESDVGYNYL